MWFFCEFFQIVANLQNFFHIFIEKNLCIGEPGSSKPVLFRGHCTVVVVDGDHRNSTFSWKLNCHPIFL